MLRRTSSTASRIGAGAVSWNASSGWLFFRLFNLLSDQPIPENLVTVRLMTRRYVSALVSHRERKMMIAGLWALTGFNQIARTIARGAKGQTSYSFSRKVSLLVDSITSFSDRPLVLIFYLGLAIGGTSSLAAVYLVVRRLFLRRCAPRVAVADRVGLDARRTDAHLPRHHRHLPVEGIHRDQATTVHDRPADLRTGHAGTCLRRFVRPSDVTTKTGSVSSDRRRAGSTGIRPSRRRCASTSSWSCLSRVVSRMSPPSRSSTSAAGTAPCSIT